MVFGDIPSCLIGDMAASNTYYPNYTYATAEDGKTGAFKVMHDHFCFTVMADAYADYHDCPYLPNPWIHYPGSGFNEYQSIIVESTAVMNKPPVAACADRVVFAGDDCEGYASIEDGSYDPDGDPISIAMTPAAPYPRGNNTVELTVTDNDPTDAEHASDTCLATVTVVDRTDPTISCNVHDITPSDVPVAFTATADDNCQVNAKITRYGCWAFTRGGQPIDKTSECVVSFHGDTIVIDKTGGVGSVIEWTVEATDAGGNKSEKACYVDVNRRVQETGRPPFAPVGPPSSVPVGPPPFVPVPRS
jgi:hypothetical protein